MEISMVHPWLARFAYVTGSLLLAVVSLTSASSLALADDVIRFGAPLPITGPLAPEATKQQQGYDLWAEEANKAGGVAVGNKKYKVEIVYVCLLYTSPSPRDGLLSRMP